MLERVAHFSILQKLGQGGMGIVFKAQDTKLRRLVALKLLAPEHVGDAERRARFMREARSAAAVTHPNIATIYEIGEDDAGRIFIAMELALGRSLRDELIAKKTLDVTETLAIARQVARGLAKAHEIGLVHRDLKPDNLMVGPEGEVKILDFGLAKAREVATPSMLAAAVTGEIGAVTDAGVILGTPGYMSPEQATGGDVDARSDLFALGIVIFEMLTGKLPFRGSTVGELLVAVARDEPRSLVEYAPEAAALDPLITRCLARARDARPSDARALLAELDALDTTDAKKQAASDVAFAPTQRVEAVAPRPDPIAPTDPPPALSKVARPRRRRLPAVAAIMLGVTTLSGIAWKVSRTGAPVATVADAATDAAAPTGLLDIPDPDCNEAARIEFRAGLVEVHGRGVTYGREHFENAIKADPTCAEAYLRASIDTSGTSEAREQFSRASMLHDKLRPDEAALLNAYAPFYDSQPPSYREAARRMLALSRAHPFNADYLVQLGFFLAVYDPNGELPKLAQRAIDIDPGFSTAWYLLGIGRMKAGDEAGAQAAYDHCVATISTTVDCLQESTRHEQWMGRCDDMQAHARTLTSRMPGDKEDAYRLFASALAATGADPSAVGEALHQADVSVPPAQAFRVELDQARFALAYGDFEHAETLLASVEQRLKGSANRSRHATVAQLRFDLALETDRPRAALAVAEDFAARQSAWDGPLDESYGSGDEGFHLVPRMLAMQAAAGKITAARRDKEIAVWTAHNDTVGDDRLGWIAQWSWVETPADAARAVAVMPVPDTDASAPKLAPLRGFSAASIGRVLALGGRMQAGIEELQRVTRRCERLDSPIIQTQAYLWLGAALSAAGPNADACTAYGVVVARWGNAHPPSKSAKRAAERMKALGCQS